MTPNPATPPESLVSLLDGLERDALRTKESPLRTLVITPDFALSLVAVARAARILTASYGVDPNQKTAFGTDAVIVERERFDALAAALDSLSPTPSSESGTPEGETE